MQELTIPPAESLQLIESMINKAKNRFSENGHLYLLWGWVVFICAIIHFFTLSYSLLEHPEMIWMLTWVAFIYQFVYIYCVKRKQVVKAYTDEILNAVWLVFVACGFIAAIITGSKGYWTAMYSLFLMLYGIPTILSGVILRFKPLIWGGLTCWIFSIISVFLAFMYLLPLIALAVVIAWIIPGYLLKAQHLKTNIQIN